MKGRCLTGIRRAVQLALLCLIIIIFSGCAKKMSTHTVMCNLDEHSPYQKVVQQILPSFATRQAENRAYSFLENGDVSEAFDTQAVGALENGVAKHWVAQYLATVIIAVDRDQTDALITGWNDLIDAKQKVGFFDLPVDQQMFVAAMSYGLEGERFSLTRAVELLAALHDAGHLAFNTFEPGILICYDYQAAALIRSGRNIDIIVPVEGTLTYEKGLLSNEKLFFEDDANALILADGLRLPDGQSDPSLYPAGTAYAAAKRVSDYNHFATVCQDTSRAINRDVRGLKRFMTIDSREDQFVALISIIIVTAWAVSVMRRSMQKGVRYAALATGIILVGWILTRLIKYQTAADLILSRYLWYSYYLFLVPLPLVMLWMAWAIDKQESKTFLPKGWRVLTALCAALIFLVFTNDLHGLVFHLDLDKIDWNIDYSYGIGYYAILFFCLANLVAMFVVLVKKSFRTPRKMGFIFPLAVFVLFAAYVYGYVVRVPIAYQTDFTIITGLFTMLVFEACIRSGLIPVNTKYIRLFSRSPLKMQIVNSRGEVALTSATAETLGQDVLCKVLAAMPVPIHGDVDSLLFANAIPGGHIIWSEDISRLNLLHEQIKESTQMLTEANFMLAKEEKQKRAIDEANAKMELMTELEVEIVEKVEQLSSMLGELPTTRNRSQEIARIALLLCYIKRRCNLFFHEREIADVAGEELILYIDELCEIAEYSNVRVVTVSEINKAFSVRYATLFYDFFYTVVDWAAKVGCPHIIAHLGPEGERLTLRLLVSEDAGTLKPEHGLVADIAAAQGIIVVKDLEDATGINLSFPIGGAACE